MTEGHTDNRHDGTAASRGAADWLSLAPAPAFAIMAWLAAAHGNAPGDILCAAAHGGSPPGGMVPMYVVMAAAHDGPWVRLLTERRMPLRPQLT